MKFLFSFIVLISMQFDVFAQKKLTPVDASSNVGFTIKNFGLTVDGCFSGLKGTIILDEKKQLLTSIDVTVAVNSIDTKNDKRDKHLKEEDYFDAKKFPTMRIKSTLITPTKIANQYILTASLSIKNVIKTISLPITVLRTSTGYALTGKLELNRLDYKVGKSSMALGNLVKVNLNVLAQ